MAYLGLGMSIIGIVGLMKYYRRVEKSDAQITAGGFDAESLVLIKTWGLLIVGILFMLIGDWNCH